MKTIVICVVLLSGCFLIQSKPTVNFDTLKADLIKDSIRTLSTEERLDYSEESPNLLEQEPNNLKESSNSLQEEIDSLQKELKHLQEVTNELKENLNNMAERYQIRQHN